MIHQNWFIGMKMVDETIGSQTFYDEDAMCFYVVSDDALGTICIREISKEDATDEYYKMCEENDIEYEREYEVSIVISCNDIIRAQTKEDAINQVKKMKCGFHIEEIKAVEFCYERGDY